jgi:hypothetical protein
MPTCNASRTRWPRWSAGWSERAGALAAVVGGLERAGSPATLPTPHRDLDLASYGVVAVPDHQHGTTNSDMTWEPK